MRPRFKLALGIVALTGALFVAGSLETRKQRDSAAAPATAMPSVTTPAEPLHVARPAAPAPVARVTAEPVASEALAPVQGSVLDARTRAPLPWFELDIESAGTPVERVQADAKGRFRSAGVFALTDLTLGYAERVAAPKSPFDERWQRFASPPGGTFVESRRADGELVVLAEVGPTFHIALELPGVGPAPSFIVRLRTAPAADARRRFITDWSVVTVLRHEGGTWARFAPIDARVAGNGPWLLSVESLDGLWYGEAAVDHLLSPQHVAIELEALAHLTVAVLGPEGMHELGVALQLIHLGDGEGEERRWEWDSTAEARHALELLPAGDYLLRAGSLRHESVEQRMRLAGGEDAELELRVRRRPFGGPIAGVLQSTTNAFIRHSSIASVQLRRAGESRILETATPTWERSGDEWPCTFRFADLPAGEYEVSVLSLEGGHRWEPARARVVPPATDLVFVRRDDLPTEDLELEVLDARGEPAGNLFFQYTIQGSEEQTLIGSSPLAIRRVALGLDVDWAVSAAGFRPLHGNRAAFTLVDGNRRVLRAQMRPGWGARISARTDERGMEGPLAGVHVTIDGESAGTTDAGGLLDVERDSPPRSMQAVLPGWAWTGVLDKRSLTSPRLTLLMRPERKL